MLRESAEVVAIVIAGLWALYVFVYENRIKPALAPPSPIIAVEMRHVGNDGDLAVIRLDETIRNPGAAAVYFLGYSVTVLGSNVIAPSSPAPATTQDFTNELEAYNTYSHAKPIYRDAFVTEEGTRGAGHGLYVQPGQTTAFSKEFYVPRRRFDHLTAWVVAVCTTSDASIPTTMTIKPPRLPSFHIVSGVPAYRIAAPMADLDLKAE